MAKRVEIPAADIARQKAIARHVAALHTPNIAPLALVITFGCQQNEADSEILRGHLSDMGYGFTDTPAAADIVLINTCAVREHAEDRAWGHIGALVHSKRENPNQIIVLCGCMAQQTHVAEKIRDSYRHVDLVFGPHGLWRLPEFVYDLLTAEGRRGRIFENDESDGEIAEDLPRVRRKGPTAWLTIMYGCNNFCTYCIVPHVRGRERSREPGRIVADFKTLLADGAKDITLLGQNVNSYGHDLNEPTDFAALLEQLNALPGQFRIRFMTSHPKDAGERLFATMARCDKVAKHIHLPVQAGNSRVLTSMNRGYTKEAYLAQIALARQYMPTLVITSDIIVGFPGESAAEFEDTLDVLRVVEFDALFTFIFSPRIGTPAADMDDPVPRAEKQVCFDRMIALQNEISLRKQTAYVGTIQTLLIDGADTANPAMLTARTDGGRLVRLAGDSALIGRFVQAKITDASTFSLTGEVI